MKGNLKRKETRTVYEEKIVRLTIDISMDEIESSEGERQDFLNFLDVKVGRDVSVDIGGFDDEDQHRLVESVEE
jgi:hypothetical protein